MSDEASVSVRTELQGELELREEIARLETIIRATAKHEGKTAIVIELQKAPDGTPEPSVRFVVSGPAFKDAVLVKAGKAALDLYLRVWQDIETKRVAAEVASARQKLKESAEV